MKILKLFLVLLLLLYPSLQGADSVAYAGVRMAKSGVQYILNFELFEVDGVDFRIDASDAGTDCAIRRDQAATSTATNDFVDEGSTYSLTITAAEMNNIAELIVEVIDQDTTKVFLDRMFVIQTYGSATAQHAFDLDVGTQTVNAFTATSGAVDLNLTSTGNIGIDWANVENKTSVVDLSATDINESVGTATAITTGAITAAAIAADAITEAKIADNAIAVEHIAANAIGASELATDAIGAAELAADSITSSELAASAAAEITDDWETQSQSDPTGFHINVLEWTGTGVTLGSGAPDVNVQSEDNIDFGATKKASINTEVDNALDTALPASPTTGSINDILDIQEEGVVTGSAATGTLSTTEMTTDLTVTVNDQFNGRIITFRKDTTTAALRGQQTDITDTVTTDGKLTFTALTTAPVNGDIFEIN